LVAPSDYERGRDAHIADWSRSVRGTLYRAGGSGDGCRNDCDSADGGCLLFASKAVYRGHHIERVKRMNQLDVALYFDVEDYFHPPEMGSDDIIQQFAQALDAEDLRGNFLFIAVRAQLLNARGRRDVVESLAKHEIGLHTLTAEHPCLPEYTAGKDWDTAVALARAHEAKGWEILQEVFGRDPACISHHAQYVAPYTFPVAKEFGVPHVYGYPAAPPLYSLSWYAGALNIPSADPVRLGTEVLSYFEFGDENYSDEAGFERSLRALDRQIAACLA